jgi:hypothetical protein
VSAVPTAEFLFVPGFHGKDAPAIGPPTHPKTKTTSHIKEHSRKQPRGVPTKAAAWREVERLQIQKTQPQQEIGTTMREVIGRYQAERMPTRPSTAYVYRSFLKNTSRQSGKTHSSGKCNRVRLSFGSVS